MLVTIELLNNIANFPTKCKKKALNSELLLSVISIHRNLVNVSCGKTILPEKA
jgi:hypothetical protein